MVDRDDPAGAWDCHAHVIDDRVRYPLAAGRGYDPPDAPLDDYLAMLDRHRLARGVLVQPSVYGFDNSCLLDALRRADGRLLGVAVPAPDASAGDLETMHRLGVRGIRCNLINPGGLDPDTVIRWLPVLRELHWHVAFHIDATHDIVSLVRRFDVPVVIDHMGRPEPGRGDPDLPENRRLIELVKDGACFVKLSAPYRLSNATPPWADVAPLARALLAANTSACLWATDWPHTDTAPAVRADDLFTALDDWCPDVDMRRVMLVDAPRRLFDTV